jgi:hypothetical protein
MIATVLAISAAYVVMGVLLLVFGLTSRLVWWSKAVAIVVMSGFFIAAFFATKSLLGWPGIGALPAKFQLLWARVVEPDPKLGDPGAIYFWIEEVDDNNVPSGLPRSYKMPYTRTLADRSVKARDEIMSGNAQEGIAADFETDMPGDSNRDGDISDSNKRNAKVETAEPVQGQRNDYGGLKIEFDQALSQAQRVEFRAMPPPALPPKRE